ncbi:hypothetical protein PHYPSEUDO_005474 [Phytophthora pseudosyringae]|uniref:Uncharacterized protein n=1 Tax=Phytophthora pseudosyringae TaxID=221518 RepID=A0A8T1VKW8_9STRA|nr:hypothetical protein PHYPSEUDO_005474 [Phytophthora pseudosyringae]
MKIDGIPIPKDYKSPLQQRGERKEDAAPRKIPTKQDFVQYMNEKPKNTDNTQICGRCVFLTTHTLADGRQLLRIHLTDLLASETDVRLKAKYEDNNSSNQFSADKDLMTGTIWDVDETSKGLPARGQMVTIIRFTKPKLFREECCQFTTRLQDLRCKDLAKQAVSIPAKKDGAQHDSIAQGAAPPNHIR